MNLTRIVVLAAAVMIPSSWTLASAGEPAAAPAAGEKTEKAAKGKKEGASGDSAKAGDSTEKKAEKK